MKLLTLKLIKNYILLFVPFFNKNNLLNKNLTNNLKNINFNYINNKIPFTVKNYSTYINFKLDNEQKSIIENYINKYSKNLELVPIKLFLYDKPNYIISINFYNCSSPLFFNNNKEITRCEINTYVKDKNIKINKNNNFGTLILDYNSNYLSLDPINLFKRKSDLLYLKNNKFIKFKSQNNIFNLSVKINYLKFYEKKISDELIKYTDNIYYKNNIYDKLAYDDSLIKTIVKIPFENNIEYFKYNNINFTNIHSIFYFQNNINFFCKLWDNL